MSSKINVQGTEIVIFQQNEQDYISLTDIARSKNPDEPRFVIQNWMKTRFTIDFLGIWEQIHNPKFNRVEFDTFKTEAGTNAFVMTPQKWIAATKAVGIVSKAGRYGGGTFAHRDIAFEFATWISPEFKLYLIKEFQRLKEEEEERKQLGWDAKRMLSKLNYKIHTDAIQAHIIPKLTARQAAFVYANEADVLNMALFGLTAKEWRERHPDQEGNMRDYADVSELVCLANLESMNAELIRQAIPQGKRLIMLNEIAIVQMRSLLANPSTQRLSGMGNS